MSTVFALGKMNTANSMANEATIRGATEKEENGKGGAEGAGRKHDGIGANYFVS
jgi:hypothetical protein